MGESDALEWREYDGWGMLLPQAAMRIAHVHAHAVPTLCPRCAHAMPICTRSQCTWRAVLCTCLQCSLHGRRVAAWLARGCSPVTYGCRATSTFARETTPPGRPRCAASADPMQHPRAESAVLAVPQLAWSAPQAPGGARHSGRTAVPFPAS